MKATSSSSGGSSFSMSDKGISGGATGMMTMKKKYRGVRKRKWGKWVSEVRLPNSRDRIWLGSYDSADKAARAFDAALFCLRGQEARLNFPNNPPTHVPSASACSLTHQQIQSVAARHAYSASDAEESETNTPATMMMTTESEAGTVDWSFLDLLTEEGGFPIVDDGLYFDFIIPPAAAGPLQAAAAAEEGIGNSFLWNF